MTIISAERVTIDKVDSSKTIAAWKATLADRGRRRHLSYTIDFDARAFTLDEPGDGWDDEVKRQHRENRERVKAGLVREFGESESERKVQDFIAIGTKPLSVLSYHNKLFDHVRRAFVSGAYYPALVGACALGERILNHLILDLRDSYKNTPEYRKVHRKDSFDNWDVPIDALESWGVLLPRAVQELRALKRLRNKSIHFNVGTYSTLRADALAAIHHMREIIDQQFSSFGIRPWFIKGTRGFIFIKREWEGNPFISKFYLPTSPFVGPYFAVSFERGLQYHDLKDYGDGDWSDDEFAEVYEARKPEQLVKEGQGVTMTLRRAAESVPVDGQ